MMETVNQMIQSSSSEAVPVSLDDLETMEMQLSGLRDGISHDHAELTKCIRSKIEQLRNKLDDESSKPSRRELLYSIVGMLESLGRSSLFFKKLRGGTALSMGKRFTDVPHGRLDRYSLWQSYRHRNCPKTSWMNYQ